MKQLISFFTIICCTHLIAAQQTGTIKISKPVPAPEKKRNIPIGVVAATNYTFKGNKKVGYEVGVHYFRPSRSNSYALAIGIQYAVEEQYYQLPAYDKRLQQPATAFSKSENHSQYLKVPLQFAYSFYIAKNVTIAFRAGLQGEYLLATKDEHQRLSASDFNQYNLAGTVYLGTGIRRFSLGFRYSKDLFENLKDHNLYDANGTVTGKQKSRTNLLSFGIGYRI